MQGPSCVGRTAPPASWGSAGACRDTGAPLDNSGEDTQTALVVFRRRRTWALLGNWTWGYAGLQVKRNTQRELLLREREDSSCGRG